MLVAVTAGALLSVALGVYGKVHTPTGGSIALLGFDNMIQMKVWLGLATGVLVLVQLVTALWMYGRLGLHAERARLLPAGLLLLDAASRALGAPLQLAGGGLREGVVMEQLALLGGAQRSRAGDLGDPAA